MWTKSVEFKILRSRVERVLGSNWIFFNLRCTSINKDACYLKRKKRSKQEDIDCLFKQIL